MIDENERLCVFMQEVIDRNIQPNRPRLRVGITSAPVTSTLCEDLKAIFPDTDFHGIFDQLDSKGEFLLDACINVLGERHFQIEWRIPEYDFGGYRGECHFRGFPKQVDFSKVIELFGLTIEAVAKSIGISYYHQLDEPFV